jgi:iron(III) transport system substrate-binding protein
MMAFSRFRSWLGVAAACAAFALCLPAVAQTAAPTTASLGRLTGPDRTQRLIEGAKREGALTVYSSIPLATMTEITGAFEKKYGIKVNLWRAESTQIVQRAVNEGRGGRASADVVETAAAETEALQRERLLQEVALPVFADLMPGAVVPGRAWVASRLTVFVVGYNTRLVRPADAPKTYADLLDPKWKGKIGIEAENANWLMSISGLEGQDKIEKLFRDIVAKNGMSFRRGHTLMVQLIAAGEVPIGINVYNDHVDLAKMRGAPVEMVFMPPSIAMPLGLAAFRNAPHPHAAILFMDFLLGEGQQLVAAHKMIPTNIKLKPLPAGLTLHLLDVPNATGPSSTGAAKRKSSRACCAAFQSPP